MALEDKFSGAILIRGKYTNCILDFLYFYNIIIYMLIYTGKKNEILLEEDDRWQVRK